MEEENLNDPLLHPPPPPITSHVRNETVTNIAQVYKLLVMDNEVTKDNNENENNNNNNNNTTMNQNNYNNNNNINNTNNNNNTNNSTTNLFGSVSNLCSATLGAGVLSLPYAIYQSGIIIGIVLLFVAAIATITSIRILTLCIDYYKYYISYETLTQYIISNNARIVTEISMLLFCCGCAIAYMIAVGDILQQANLLLYNNRSYSMIIAYIVFMLPLSMLYKIQSLQFASATGIAAIGTLVFASFIHWITDIEHTTTTTTTTNYNNRYLFTTLQHDERIQLSDYLWPANGFISVLTACPVVLFAFSCQTNVCAIYDELQIVNNNNNNNYNTTTSNNNKQIIMKKVTYIAVLICSTLYGSVSIIVLGDFGKYTKPNMLSNYDNNNSGSIMQVATAAMAFAVIMAFPLNIFPARTTLIGLLEKHNNNNNNNNNTSTTGRRQQQQQQLLLSSSPHYSKASTTTTTTSTSNTTTSNVTIADNNNNNENERLSVDVENNDDNNEIDSDDDNNDDMMTELLPTSSSHHHLTPLQVRPADSERFLPPLGEQDINNNINIEPTFNVRVHIVTTLFLTGMTLGFALILPNISVVFGLLGGTASSILGFCIPGLLGIRLSKDLYDETNTIHYNVLIPSWLLLIGGIAVGILTTGVTIYDTLLL